MRTATAPRFRPSCVRQPEPMPDPDLVDDLTPADIAQLGVAYVGPWSVLAGQYDIGQIADAAVYGCVEGDGGMFHLWRAPDAGAAVERARGLLPYFRAAWLVTAAGAHRIRMAGTDPVSSR